MKTTTNLISIIMIYILLASCNEKKEIKETSYEMVNMETMNDSRISLQLNSMQKQHQLINMRSHLEAVQTIINLLSKDEYDKASEVAYNKLGSTTKMRMMCASFGNKEFETMGLDFHNSADEMSEVFKTKDKDKSLEALSNTMNYCVSCHSTFSQ